MEGKYCRGYCGEFAVALHRVFGYKLGGFYEKESDDWGTTFSMIHLFAYHPTDKNLVIDARGIRPKETVKSSLISFTGKTPKKLVERRTTENDIDAEGGEGLNKELVDEAIEYIHKNKQKYQVK